MVGVKPNGSVKIAILGAGALGHAWSKVVDADPGARLAAIIDPLVGTEAAPAWIDEHPDVPRARSLGELGLVSLDAAVVTAFSPAHADAIRAALEHGLHVIVEKPFTTSLDDAHALVELAARRGLTLMVSQNYRHFPGVATLRNLVAGERFGRIRSVAGAFSYDWAGKPYQHRMQHVMGLEMAVHHFDLVRALFDADPVTGFVREWNSEGSQYAGGGGLEALFEMASPRDAFPFVYSGSLIGKAPPTPWGGNWRFEFDQATLIVDTIDGRYGIYQAHAKGHDWIAPFADEIRFDGAFSHFLASLAAGREPWSSGRDNLGTLRMALGFLVGTDARRRAA
ncbi:MAG TPA: Gfo/Idh/MocA family oxidoreductase [Kaistia sp.]|nr:Gfo/Idh/MocA family oxidoreductase [Kaistia sp.]